MSSETVVNNWCRNNNLLPTVVNCPSKVKIGTHEDGSYIYKNCGGNMYLKERRGKPGNSTFRCTINRNHERGIRYLSYFEILIYNSSHDGIHKILLGQADSKAVFHLRRDEL